MSDTADRIEASCCAHERTPGGASEVQHPLQSLTPEEIRHAAEIVRDDPPYGKSTRFETIELFEPEKSVVKAFQPGAPISRRARVNVFSTDTIGVTRLVVSLDERAGSFPARSFQPLGR